MREVMVRNNNIKLRVHEVLNNAGTFAVSRCYMLDTADQWLRFSQIDYGNEKHPREITSSVLEASRDGYSFEKNEELYNSRPRDAKDRLQSLNLATSCIHCLFQYHESTIVPNPAHPMYLRWAYKIYGGDAFLDNHYKQHQIQQQIYKDVAEGNHLPPFVQCVCQRCRTEWIVFEKQHGDYKQQIFEQLVARGMKGKPEQKAVDETIKKLY